MTQGGRRARRHDPERRDKLIEAALTVLGRDGLAATTHRSIAREADVPLGSTTYHFASLDDLVALAFERHVDTLASRFEERMMAAANQDNAIDALVESLTDDLVANPGVLAVTYELYGASVRRPALKKVTQEWMRRAEDALCEHFDRSSARLLDTVVEGLMVHMSIAQQPLSRDEVRALLTRSASAADPAPPGRLGAGESNVADTKTSIDPFDGLHSRP
jgi:DNA-binding transcriptional regulator YbjK